MKEMKFKRGDKILRIAGGTWGDVVQGRTYIVKSCLVKNKLLLEGFTAECHVDYFDLIETSVEVTKEYEIW